MSVTRVVLVLAVLAAPLSAQRWVSGAQLPVVREASALRRAQATDTALASWRASAQGSLRYTAAPEPGVVTQTDPLTIDEMDVVVYGRLPDRLKQVITRWRDTTIRSAVSTIYHRDHLGIVASD